ncbi:MAG: RNA methyltransferase [Bacteroidetes bacterium]|jgi:TrmH family RNA methyltransferase|nr:RNA methyltransferase [Bacteroidota bacterium]
MLTAHKIKVIQSLDKKKFRQKYNLFVVEGNKNIRELHQSQYKIKEIFSIEPKNIDFLGVLPYQITEKELRNISFLQNPKDSLAICEILQPKEIAESDTQIILDGIQDPGNLGTIIRLADWFGISQIICSEDTVDYYNPKVIQATMGSFTRTEIFYTDLEIFLQTSKNQNIGTDMDGESIYKFNFPRNINIILGNEGNGIRPKIEKLLQDKITIPRFGNQKSTESLNVSMAGGIILGQLFSKK